MQNTERTLILAVSDSGRREKIAKQRENHDLLHHIIKTLIAREEERQRQQTAKEESSQRCRQVTRNTSKAVYVMLFSNVSQHQQQQQPATTAEEIKLQNRKREKLDLTKDHVDRKRNKSQTRIFTAMPASDNRSASPSVDALEIDNPNQQLPSLAYKLQRQQSNLQTLVAGKEAVGHVMW